MSLNIPPSPIDFATQLLNFHPDPVQSALLARNPQFCILNCTRQWGKSHISAIKALHTALATPAADIIVISPSARQSAELVRKIAAGMRKLAIPRRGDGYNDISLAFPNGSRIVGLPGKDSTIRGFSQISLLIVDEASRVPDELYIAVRPMLATSSGGQIWLISTPAGCRGFFHQTFTAGDPEWTTISVTAAECPRITPAFLEREKRLMSPRIFRQEYFCEFIDSDEVLFPASLLDQSLIPADPLILTLNSPSSYEPLIRDPLRRREMELALNALPRPLHLPPPAFFIGVDLGQQQDYTAISIIERSIIVCGERNWATYEFPTEARYTVRHLARLPLHTSYHDAVDHIRRLARHPNLGRRKTIVIDETGVGRPVVELLRKARPEGDIISVTITSGHAVSRQGSSWCVPRNHLLTGLEIGFTGGSLRIADTLPSAPVLINELRALRRTAIPEQTTSPQHDDLAFATALSYWAANQPP